MKKLKRILLSLAILLGMFTSTINAFNKDVNKPLLKMNSISKSIRNNNLNHSIEFLENIQDAVLICENETEDDNKKNAIENALHYSFDFIEYTSTSAAIKHCTAHQKTSLTILYCNFRI